MKPKTEFLYTNIGRGHPHYLDGIIEAMVRSGDIGLMRHSTDVFEVSRGLSRFGWRLVKWMYQTGSQPGWLVAVYSHLRAGTDYNKGGLAVSVLGRDLKRHYQNGADPLVVAHPLLAAILAGRANLIYQHGELVVPTEARVKGASTVVVPTDECAATFTNLGYSSDQIFVSGLCLEPAMSRQAGDCYEQRLKRLGGDGPLTGLLVSSGAEPADHVDLLSRALRSVTDDGGRALVLARAGGNLERRALKAAAGTGILPIRVDPSDLFPSDLPPILIAVYNDRRELNALAARLFPWVDYLIAPAHERTSWSVGLGLPMFVLTPDKGSYAPLNHQLLLQHETGQSLADSGRADRLGPELRRLRRNGRLQQMARAGWGNYRLDGFSRIAAWLAGCFGD